MDHAAVPAVADPGIVAVELDGRLSLYRPATQRVLNLNESASVIWIELEDECGRSVAELAVELAARFGVDEQTMLGDVAGTVEQLAEAGFLRVAEPDGEG